jgi:hypothetical protein
MSEDPDRPEDATRAAAERAARRRRLEEVFGETLPEQTGDDTDEPGPRTDSSDEWLRRQVPPHHGH